MLFKKLEWDQSMSMGVDTLDRQHQDLIDRINDLRSAIGKGKARSEIGRIVAFLEEYVRTHFTMEETLMKRKKYPAYVAHRQEHLNFLTVFLEFKQRFDAMDAEGAIVSFLAVEMDRKLADWLIDHISKTDRQFGDFLSRPQQAARGIELPGS